MSENEGTVKFTTILLDDTVTKLDFLKSLAHYNNRNKVVTDAVDFLDFVCKTLGYAMTQSDEMRMRIALSKIEEKARNDLGDYWGGYHRIFSETPSK